MRAKTQLVSYNSDQFEPKSEYILVKPAALETEKTTAGGIVIAVNQSVIDRPTIGEVVQVSDEIENFSIGDVIMWPNTDGLDLEFEDGVHILLRQNSILGRIKEQD